MSGLPEKHSLQENRVFMNINLEGRGSPTTNGLDKVRGDAIESQRCGTPRPQ